MMIQFVFFIIFLVAVAGILFILARKIPTLVQLPQNGHHGFKKPSLVADLEKKIKAHHFHLFEKQMLMQTLLSKFRLFVLKTERKIDELLHGMRKKAQELDRRKK